MGKTWTEKKADDKRAVQDVLSAIGVEASSVLNTYRFNAAANDGEDSQRSRPPPVRVFMANQPAVVTALRRAHLLADTDFKHVFLRRDLSKEDIEVEKLARQAKDEQNKVFTANKITNVKCIVSNTGKVGQVWIVSTEKRKPDATGAVTTSATATAAAATTTPAQQQQESTSRSSTSSQPSSTSPQPFSTSQAQSVTQATTSATSTISTSSAKNSTQPGPSNIRNNLRNSRSATRKSNDPGQLSASTPTNDAAPKDKKKGGIPKQVHEDLQAKLAWALAEIESLKAQHASRSSQDEMDVVEAANPDNASCAATQEQQTK